VYIDHQKPIHILGHIFCSKSAFSSPKFTVFQGIPDKVDYILPLGIYWNLYALVSIEHSQLSWHGPFCPVFFVSVNKSWLLNGLHSCGTVVKLYTLSLPPLPVTFLDRMAKSTDRSLQFWSIPPPPPVIELRAGLASKNSAKTPSRCPLFREFLPNRQFPKFLTLAHNLYEFTVLQKRAHRVHLFQVFF
jgi:hypothetical protein